MLHFVILCENKGGQMKQEKQEFISVRVPGSMKHSLKKKAHKDNRKLSDYLRLLFFKAIK